jgi:hypothetical protein
LEPWWGRKMESNCRDGCLERKPAKTMSKRMTLLADLRV